MGSVAKEWILSLFLLHFGLIESSETTPEVLIPVGQDTVDHAPYNAIQENMFTFVHTIQYRDPRWVFDPLEWTISQVDSGDVLEANKLYAKSEISVLHTVRPMLSMTVHVSYLLQKTNLTQGPSLKLYLRSSSEVESDQLLHDFQPSPHWQISTVGFLSGKSSEIVFKALLNDTRNKIILGDVTISQNITNNHPKMAPYLIPQEENSVPEVLPSDHIPETPAKEYFPSTVTPKPEETSPNEQSTNPLENSKTFLKNGVEFHRTRISGGTILRAFLTALAVALITLCIIIGCRLRKYRHKDEEVAIYARHNDGDGYQSDIDEVKLSKYQATS